MRYFRVLFVLPLLAAIGVGAIALADGPAASPPPQLQRAVQQAAQRYVAAQRRLFAPVPNVVPPQFRNVTPPLAPFAPSSGGTTCYVDSTCSITPCVVPVASAVAALPTGRGCPLGDRVPQRMLPVTAR